MLVFEDFKDLSILNLARPDRLEPLLHSEFDEGLGDVSPDGNWIAYESNESGDQFEIFLRPFPDVERATGEGLHRWRALPCGDRRAAASLFYVDLNGEMMAASVKLSPSLSLGRVTKLFEWEKPRASRREGRMTFHRSTDAS